MEMLLMAGALSLIGIAVMALAFGAATRPESPEQSAQTQPEKAQPAIPARFFVQDAAIPTPPYTSVPIEALLLQIEDHVRLEQAVAQSFVDYPTSSLLHSKTVSTLIQ